MGKRNTHEVHIVHNTPPARPSPDAKLEESVRVTKADHGALRSATDAQTGVTAPMKQE